MNITKTKEALKKEIMATEWHWITPSVLNERAEKGIKVIQMNLDNGKIKSVDEKVIGRVAFLLIDEMH